MTITRAFLDAQFRDVPGAKLAIMALAIRGFDLSAGSPAVNDYGIYDDAIVIDWVDDFRVFACTTDPSKRYIREPINKEGTAVVKAQQLLWFKKGLHHGHEAFIQDSVFEIYRLDRHGSYNLGSDGRPLVYRGDNDDFGIHLHSGGDVKDDVGPWSAGCFAIYSPEGGWGKTWQNFYNLVTAKMGSFDQERLPCLLIDNPEGKNA